MVNSAYKLSYVQVYLMIFIFYHRFVVVLFGFATVVDVVNSKMLLKPRSLHVCCFVCCDRSTTVAPTQLQSRCDVTFGF